MRPDYSTEQRGGRDKNNCAAARIWRDTDPCNVHDPHTHPARPQSQSAHIEICGAIRCSQTICKRTVKCGVLATVQKFLRRFSRNEIKWIFPVHIVHPSIPKRTARKLEPCRLCSAHLISVIVGVMAGRSRSRRLSPSSGLDPLRTLVTGNFGVIQSPRWLARAHLPAPK